MNSSVLNWLTLFIGFLSLNVCESSILVTQGNSLTIINVNDNSYLTSTEHTYRAEYGFYAGRVLAEEEFYGTPNQIWDTIRWPDTPKNQFWLYPKGATLNEITVVPFSDLPIPPANLVEFIYVQSVNQTGEFLIKSTILNKCVQSPGPNFIIAYEQCDELNLAQQWRAEKHYDDKERKTKFYCKFHGK